MKKFLALPLFLTLLAPLHAQISTPPAPPDPWYNHAVVYEIYPRSFQDTNGDGIGDLNGITKHLDYLESLGVTALWIAPMYPSPQVDFGYDISNYTAVDPQYGTLADFDRLVASAKAHHIRILLDMVLNHTSDKHAWFLDSASSRTNSHADWYIWNDGIPAPKRAATAAPGLNEHLGPNGWVVPPNNWSSLFQGSAWEWVPARGQFYYHFFYKQQPDLNWHNPAVEKAMFDAMRFWLDRGVSGFRLDAITTLFEDPALRNEPLTGKLDASGFAESNHTLTSDLPEVHDVLRRLRKMTDSYPDQRVLIGEIYTAATAQLVQWYGTPAQPELQLPMDTLVGFHSEGNGQTGQPNVALNLDHLRRTLTEMQTQLVPNQPLLVFDNHDNTRSWDRFGDGVHNPLIARIIATLLFTSRATALMYYGEELGMHTQVPTRKEDVRDPIGITGWPQEKGRDGERTPMQWSPAPQAGFSTNPQTWLPVEPDYKTINAKTESKQSDSLLEWNERLMFLRRSYAALSNGATTFVDNQNPYVLTYVRSVPTASSPVTIGDKPIVVAVNMSGQEQTLHLNLSSANISADRVHILANSANISGSSIHDLTLSPYASVIAELDPSVSAAVSDSTTIRIRFVNGKSGKPLHLKYYEGGDATNTKSAYTVDRVEGDSLVVTFKKVSTFSFRSETFAPCDVGKGQTILPQYNLQEVVSHGVTAPNHCGPAQEKSKPGELIIYSRHEHWWKITGNIARGLLICA